MHAWSKGAVLQGLEEQHHRVGQHNAGCERLIAKLAFAAAEEADPPKVKGYKAWLGPHNWKPEFNAIRTENEIVIRVCGGLLSVPALPSAF